MTKHQKRWMAGAVLAIFAGGGIAWAIDNDKNSGSGPDINAAQSSLYARVSAATPSLTDNTFDRLTMDTSGNLRVTIGAVSFDTTGLATEATLAGLQLSQTSTTAGQFGPLIQGAVTTSAPTYTNAKTSPLSLDTAGALRVTGGSTAGTSTTGLLYSAVAGAATSAVPSYTNAQANPLSLNLEGALRVVPHPPVAAGLTSSGLISAATTNATSVKASAGQLCGIQASNINASARYLKFYNKASAPTVGTDTPLFAPLLIPPNSSGLVFNSPFCISFSTGIAYATTTGVANSDTGAVAANEIVVNVFYH